VSIFVSKLKATLSLTEFEGIKQEKEPGHVRLATEAGCFLHPDRLLVVSDVLSAAETYHT